MKWFRHDVNALNSDQIFELVEAHGLQGYGLWWVILEQCYRSDGNGFQLNATESWFKRLSKQLNLTDWRTLIRVLDTMADLKLIDSQLWADQIIFVPGIAKRADKYTKEKELSAKRSKAYRDRKRNSVTQSSRVTNVIRHGITPSDPDPDPDPDPDLSPPTSSQEIEKSKQPRESELNDPFWTMRLRRPISVPVTPIFQGPWGTGRTPLLDEFEAKLIQEGKAKSMNDPSAYAFKVIDSIVKGGPIGKWKQLMEIKDSENSLKRGKSSFSKADVAKLFEQDYLEERRNHA